MLDINKPEPTDIKNHSLPPTDFNPYPSTLTTQSNYTTKPTTLDSGLEIGLEIGLETGLMGYNCLTYALYAISFFTAGLLAIVPLVMNYIKRDQARGTWLESHFDWQIKTFWYGLFFGMIALGLVFFGFSGFFLGLLFGSSNTAGGSVLVGVLGLLLTGILFIWHLYRLARGWIALSNRRAVP